MKKLLHLLILFTLMSGTALGQMHSPTTYLDILKGLSGKLKLELSYSPDLVALNENTTTQFSANADSCITELEKTANLRITQTDTHLIVASKAPAYIRLQGKVVDAKTGELLPYANILIGKAGAGTITNTEGAFDFKIQGRFAGSLIRFSFLGYKSQQLFIPYASDSSIVVKMIPKPYLLSDVYVLPNGTAAVDIVKRAVKNIKRNYARTTTQMEAFYRNTNYRDTIASQIIEAALLIQDRGINTQPSTTRIQVEELRKSNSYLVPQSKKEKLAFALMDKMFGGHRNILYRAYANSVRYYRMSWWYKPLTDYETFKYEFAGFEWLDSVKVYKIKFIYDKLQPDGKRASENKNSEDGGYIYVSSKDWGVLKMERWWKVLNDRFLTNMVIKDNYIWRTETGYPKISGKYYLKYKTGFATPNGTSAVYENPDAPKKERKIKERQWAEYVLLVTKVITDKKEMDKIRYREKLARDEHTYEAKYPYHPTFWETYNILKENPVQEKFIKEMEWEKSLDIQFKENSSNYANN
ncbi:carboxypeptidase-like regulatory domain-containing protein [Prolixibacter denitrificans]|uniref:Carboxypeptidase-like protein n=1 Tax=Prolixibacter denitrificans TaxID=1541063 RepID=A0A2P8C823_9BACT|nr:carboxypeptidase-like regulatory domain-containing protein [Prolixibacter denitrificans]PSK81125.1 carboxypeptidase-like protein [Prolixibacter denitrificans]GET22241.1 hypothetical protein JCM18694_24870 [Prolixibacter denitrificans]